MTPQFKLFSGALKAYTDKATGKKRVRCTASSTVEDLHGDEIDMACVMSMSNQAIAKGMTIFLNHEYKVPEDIFGKTIFAQAQKSAVDPKTAKDVWDLDLETEVNESNPRAVETWEAIDGGIKVGVSIGALIRDWEFRDAKKQWEGGLLIKDVELLEASMVGIPANPRSWVKQAARSIRRSYKPNEAGVLVLSGASATAEAIDIASDDDDDDVVIAAAIPATKLIVGEDGPEVVAQIDPEPEPEPAEESTSSSDESTTDDESQEDDTSPDVTATKSATEESDAEAEVDDEETTSTVDLEAAKSIVGSLSVAEDQDPLLEVLLGIVENAAKEVKDLREQLSAQKALADSVPGLTAERDQVRADLDEAMEVLQLMAKAPLARKATLRSVINDRGGLTQRLAHGPYDRRFLQLIDESTNEEG